MNIVRWRKPRKGAEKCKTTVSFSSKIALHFKKVCYKVSLFEYYQRQSCKAFTVLETYIGLRAKMVRGGRRYYVKIWPKLTNPFQKLGFPINNTNRKSTTRFSMNKDEECTLPLPKRGGTQKSIVQNLNNNL